LTRAKSGEEPEKKSCDNPVDEHFKLGEDFGVTGTPSLVLDDGEVIPGYVPAERLEKIMNGEKG
jgi:thiol:disulfide interchange protein DsbC